MVNIIYGALCALAQTDFKKLVAYSSISHMGFVLLGIALLTPAGFQGAMFQMIAHGITSAAMFFLVGVIYDRVHHRDIPRLGGLAGQMPVYTGLAILGFFAAMGLPGMCGFIGEIYVLLGSWQATVLGPVGAKVLTVIAAAGMVLTAGYILWSIQRVFLGPAKPEYAERAGDLPARNWHHGPPGRIGHRPGNPALADRVHLCPRHSGQHSEADRYTRRNLPMLRFERIGLTNEWSGDTGPARAGPGCHVGL